MCVSPRNDVIYQVPGEFLMQEVMQYEAPRHDLPQNRNTPIDLRLITMKDT